MNTPPSPLGTLALLPPELRALIYKAALTSPNPIQITRYHHYLISSNPANPPVTEPKKSGKAVTHRTAKNEFGPQSRVVLAHPTKPKCKLRLPAAEVFAMGLVGVSKAIRDEATPILYGGNTFDFENEYAIEAFISVVEKHTTLLRSLSFPFCGLYGRDQHLKLLSCVADPREMVIDLRKINTYHFTAARLANAVWYECKDIFQRQCVYDSPGYEVLNVPLPQALQLRRFAAVRFQVPERLKSDAGDQDGATDVIGDDGERARGFKAMVREKLVGEAEWEREVERARKKVVEEKLRASETLRAV